MPDWNGGKAKSDTKTLVGSKSHDCFRAWHKTVLPKNFYASDGDLFLISSKPLGTICLLEFKTGKDSITFTEGVLFTTLKRVGIPTFIITCDEWQGSNAFTRFRVEKFLGADLRQNPIAVKLELIAANMNQKGFEAWERKLRVDFSRTHGGSGE